MMLPSKLLIVLLFIVSISFGNCADIIDLFQKFQAPENQSVPSTTVTPPTRGTENSQFDYVRSNGFCNVELKRMIGGMKAQRNHWLFLVKFGYTSATNLDSIECEGVMISRDWILTAGHCLAGLPEDRSLLIKIGSYNCFDNGNLHRTNRVFLHSNLMGLGPFGLYKNDIGLVKLNGKVSMNHKTRVVKLGKGNIEVGTRCKIAAWRNHAKRVPKQKRSASPRTFRPTPKGTHGRSHTALPDNMYENGGKSDQNVEDYFDLWLEQIDSNRVLENSDNSDSELFKDTDAVTELSALGISTSEKTTVQKKKKKKKKQRKRKKRKRKKKNKKNGLAKDTEDENWKIFNWLSQNNVTELRSNFTTNDLKKWQTNGSRFEFHLTSTLSVTNITTETTPMTVTVSTPADVTEGYFIETLFENKDMNEDSYDYFGLTNQTRKSEALRMNKMKRVRTGNKEPKIHESRVDPEYFESEIYEKEVVIIDPQTCEMIFQLESMQDQIICTKSVINGNFSNMYLGDCGGPLVCNGRLVGIHSFGNYGQYKINRSYEVYTRVDIYEDWIYKTFEYGNPIDFNLNSKTGNVKIPDVNGTSNSSENITTSLGATFEKLKLLFISPLIFSCIIHTIVN